MVLGILRHCLYVWSVREVRVLLPSAWEKAAKNKKKMFSTVT